MKRSSIIPITIILGGMLVASAIYITTIQKAPPQKMHSDLFRPVSVTDHILGNPNASVKIIEYSDLTCKYCKDFDNTMRQIIKKYGASGNVAWVFREFPLTEIHPNTMRFTIAAECVAKTAGETAFWNFLKIIFANQPADTKNLGQYAKESGANPDAVATCIISGSVNKKINADRKNALYIGASGTPYSLITTYGAPPVIINGAYPYDYIEQEINTALNIASSTETAQK